MTCQRCKSGERCLAGVCTLDQCNATTCPKGCCDKNKRCQNGTSDTACGTGGAACATCTATQTCVSNQCKAKTASLYKVILVSLAKVSSYDCGLWDTCDFYVKLTVDKITATSTTKNDTNNPTWNETLLNASQQQILAKFEAKVYEDDWLMDTFVGDCKPKVTAADIAKGKLVTDCGQYTSLGFTKSCSLTFKFEGI